MALKVIGQEAEEREQESPLSLVFDEISQISSLGFAGLALAEKMDLPSQITDIFRLMIERAGVIEDKLEAAEA
jgi:hypothetical protein